MIGLVVGLIQHKYGACNRIITIHGSIIATGLGEAIEILVIEWHPIQSVGIRLVTSLITTTKIIKILYFAFQTV